MLTYCFADRTDVGDAWRRSDGIFEVGCRFLWVNVMGMSAGLVGCSVGGIGLLRSFLSFTDGGMCEVATGGVIGRKRKGGLQVSTLPMVA